MTLFVAQMLKPFALLLILAPSMYLFNRFFPEGKLKEFLSRKIGD